MKLFFFLVGIFALTSVAHADRVVLAESDTGIVFGDLDCQIYDHTAGAPVFFRDFFDYLTVRVTIETKCVTRDGRRYRKTGRDQAIFPTLEFDWLTQSWVTDGVTVATLRGRRVEVNSELETDVLTDGRAEHVAFRVQISRPE